MKVFKFDIPVHAVQLIFRCIYRSYLHYFRQGKYSLGGQSKCWVVDSTRSEATITDGTKIKTDRITREVILNNEGVGCCLQLEGGGEQQSKRVFVGSSRSKPSMTGQIHRYLSSCVILCNMKQFVTEIHQMWPVCCWSSIIILFINLLGYITAVIDKCFSFQCLCMHD